MKTREKILVTSLEMFNKYGIQKVSLRDIAKKIKISVGNLNYHFPTTNDIIYALSLQLIEDINNAITTMMTAPTSNSLVSIHNMMRTIFTTQLKYRFIFNGRLAEIVNTIPKMQNYYQETFQNHFIEGTQIFEQLVTDGFLTANILPNLNEFLYVQNMLGIFWQQELAIFQPLLSDNEKIQQALATVFQPYTPYLTEKGRATLFPLLKELKPYKKGGTDK
ncbi:MAG: TetR family transcriptional regulator [Fluviicola sp.]|nr:TetR family transcriptional regulator [Fluviicola sp.]